MPLREPHREVVALGIILEQLLDQLQALLEPAHQRAPLEARFGEELADVDDLGHQTHFTSTSAPIRWRRA